MQKPEQNLLIGIISLGVGVLLITNFSFDVFQEFVLDVLQMLFKVFPVLLVFFGIGMIGAYFVIKTK